MPIKKLEDYLRSCPPGPERDALLDLCDAMASSTVTLHWVNQVTLTKLTARAPQDQGTPDLFEFGN